MPAPSPFLFACLHSAAHFLALTPVTPQTDQWSLAGGWLVFLYLPDVSSISPCMLWRPKISPDFTRITERKFPTSKGKITPGEIEKAEVPIFSASLTPRNGQGCTSSQWNTREETLELPLIFCFLLILNDNKNNSKKLTRTTERPQEFQMLAFTFLLCTFNVYNIIYYYP